MTAIPDDIMKLARRAIMAEVRPEVRWQYADGRCDHFAVVQAIAKAIQAERARCASIAKNYPAGVECQLHSEPSAAANAALNIADLILLSSVSQAPSADEKSRDAALPSVSAPFHGQD